MPLRVAHACPNVELIQHHMAKDMMETEALGGALFAYNALISGCTSSRSYDRALDYLDQMVGART